MTEQPFALLESFSRDKNSRSYLFSSLESVITAHSPEQVAAALKEVEQAVASGKHAAGYVAYEAAPGLNPDLPFSGKGTLPLVWFGIFAQRQDQTKSLERTTGELSVSSPNLDIDWISYRNAIDSIRECIAQGETYQVNFTTRQRFNISGDPFTLYRRMCRNQRAPYCAWLDIGTHRILSASPELFFSLDKGVLTMKPMKGTAARRPRPDEDIRQRELLSTSSKERAENLMIVDLVRNDLSTIAETGSVSVPAMFEVETFPTLHQMTSTVTALVRPNIGLSDIFRALFPCGSVTGAPKQRTMKIINDLESSPRGVYCGAIGYLSPGREAVFSVAIRTAVVEAATGNAEIGIGSGITWDSDAESEFQECLTKSAFLTRPEDEFELIESLRYDQQGYLMLERHLGRLAISAAYFGFAFDCDSLRARLIQEAGSLTGANKVRVLLRKDGSTSLDMQPLQQNGMAACATVAVSQQRVNSADPFLYHKTTRRELYDQELRDHPACYDVIFLNQREEVTEGCFNTIVISRAGELLTPALECGLLPGVLRGELLEVGAIRETILTLDDLHRADRIWLVNSVRGWRECNILRP